jgi:hypothetical protein
MGEFRGLIRLVSSDLGPHTLPQQSTDQKPFSRLSGAIYTRSCIRTSENSYSTHSGECTFSEIHLTSEGC